MNKSLNIESLQIEKLKIVQIGLKINQVADRDTEIQRYRETDRERET